MLKVPKIVLVYEPTAEVARIYNGILESSGFIVKTSQNDSDFFEQCIQIVPDVIILNGTHEDVKEEAICKKLRKHNIFKTIPIILLVEKMGFSATNKAKALKVELEEFPLKNNKFLQTVKKITRNSLILHEVKVSENNNCSSDIHVELFDISEVHLSFLAPVKMNEKGNIQIQGKLLKMLGIEEKNFQANSKGTMHESKHYRNEVNFHGISVEVLRELKKYMAMNREKK